MHKEEDLLNYYSWGNPDVCQRYVEEKGGETFYRVSGLMNYYSYPWAWVKTNENGALELLFKLGYVIHESIYGSMVDEIREKAAFHSIDIRLIEFKYGLLLSSVMCLRNEEDAALLRLCIS